MGESLHQNEQVGRRGRSRLHVRLAARITTRTRTLRGVLCDLSLTGAGLEISEPLRLGDDVLIEWGGFEAFGSVVRMRADRCGVRFDDCVPPSVLVATRDLDDAQRLPGDRDLAREVARDWAKGVSRL